MVGAWGGPSQAVPRASAGHIEMMSGSRKKGRCAIFQYCVASRSAWSRGLGRSRGHRLGDWLLRWGCCVVGIGSHHLDNFVFLTSLELFLDRTEKVEGRSWHPVMKDHLYPYITTLLPRLIHQLFRVSDFILVTFLKRRLIAQTVFEFFEECQS